MSILNSIIPAQEQESIVTSAPTETDGTCTDPLLSDWMPKITQRNVLVVVGLFLLYKFLK